VLLDTRINKNILICASPAQSASVCVRSQKMNCGNKRACGGSGTIFGRVKYTSFLLIWD
jgi:hypothetical protein